MARHLIRTAFRTSRELSEALALLKQHSRPDEYAHHAARVGTAIDAINVALVGPSVARHPELKDEIKRASASTTASSRTRPAFAVH
jgi:hypothetical protein